MGPERDGVVAEAERVAAGERDAAERVGAVPLERGRGLGRGRRGGVALSSLDCY
jgi:hypothetical protein